MTINPVYIDSCPAYCRSGSAATPLLCVPLGTSSVLRELHAATPRLARGDAIVLADFPVDDRYRAAVGHETRGVPGVTVAASIAEIVDRCEPSDWILLMEAKTFPAGALPAAGIREAVHDARQVMHFISAEYGPGTAQENVCFDAQGSVRRIQRYYAGVTSIGTHSVVCSLVSGAVARVVLGRSVESLADLRQRLAEFHVPGRDVLLSEPAIDLTTERGFLDLHERTLERTLPDPSSGTGRCGAGARVDASARLIGSVVIQENAVVDADACIIGPAVLGAECHIGAGAVIAQSVVGCGTSVAANSVHHHRVVIADSAIEAPIELERLWTRRPAERRPSWGALARGTSHSGLGMRPAGRSRYPTFKWIVEASVSLLALAILSPFLLLTALLIKLESRGPVFYRDPREGRDGRVFHCLKFRTMIANAHELQRKLYKANQVDGPQFKLKRDTRITRVGQLLRSTNVDELPQLINVIKGEMSLIGPRPSPFRENQICVAWRQARLSVRPGITGLWQICRHERSAGDFHQWIHYDLLYVRNQSALLDLKILVATLLTFGGRWSVPLEWIIPVRKQIDSSTPFVPTRAPILQLAAPAADAKLATVTAQESPCLSA